MADPKHREVAESVFERLKQEAARRAAVVKNMQRLRALRLSRDGSAKDK